MRHLMEEKCCDSGRDDVSELHKVGTFLLREIDVSLSNVYFTRLLSQGVLVERPRVDGHAAHPQGM